jgi:hypothetical protein
VRPFGVPQGSSPILWNDLLLVAFDGHDVQRVAALHKDTGKLAWRTDRSVDYKTTNGDLKKAYSTVSVIDVEGKPRAVPFSMRRVRSPMTHSLARSIWWKVEYAGMDAATPPLFAFGLRLHNLGTHVKTLCRRSQRKRECIEDEH